MPLGGYMIEYPSCDQGHEMIMFGKGRVCPICKEERVSKKWETEKQSFQQGLSDLKKENKALRTKLSILKKEVYPHKETVIEALRGFHSILEKFQNVRESKRIWKLIQLYNTLSREEEPMNIWKLTDTRFSNIFEKGARVVETFIIAAQTLEEAKEIANEKSEGEGPIWESNEVSAVNLYRGNQDPRVLERRYR